MLQLKSFTFNPFQENTYLVFDTKSKEAVVIDPGTYTAAEQKELAKAVEENGLTVKAIWLTHSHIDHVIGLRWAAGKFKCPFYQSGEDVANLKSVPAYASAYGFHDFAMPDDEGSSIDPGYPLRIGQHIFLALPTPGHAIGHLSFYNEVLGVLAGDALFNGSIGRTDLPGGDFDTLAHSIRVQLYVLPDETAVYPGHGPATTIGREKRLNPFVRA